MKKGALNLSIEAIIKIIIALVILYVIYWFVIRNIFNIGSTAVGKLG